MPIVLFTSVALLRQWKLIIRVNRRTGIVFYTAVLKLEVKELTEYRCPGELILCDILYALSQVLLQLYFAPKTHMLDSYLWACLWASTDYPYKYQDGRVYLAVNLARYRATAYRCWTLHFIIYWKFHPKLPFSSESVSWVLSQSSMDCGTCYQQRW